VEVPAGTAGQRLRLEDVAALVGLSVSTVSLVLNNEAGPSDRTRQKVLDAAAELGYRPDRAASQLARRRSRLLGVMMDIRSTFHAELTEELQAAAEERGYDLVLSPVTRSHDERRAVDILLDFRCGALVLLGPASSPHLLGQLSQQLPVVVVGRRVNAPQVDVVRTADHEGVKQAIDHLAALGHRHIAYLDGGRGTIAADRRRGYRTAMHRHGLTEFIQVIAGDPTEEAGMRAAEALLSAETLPTAVMAFNDRSAVGLEDGLSRSGVTVPETISIVGYDDSPISRLAHVNLTTVNQNPHQQATHAVNAAVARLDGLGGDAQQIVLTPHLLARGTTAAPRKRP
jgi:DNA-binding LacI/PurR family transcriptional regulator